jgi:uncharacterized protein
MPPRIEHHSNRQYPPPASPWVMAMRWDDLLFMHWPVEASALRPFVPPALEIEIFEGAAWLAVAPFLMRGTRGRFTPAAPGISRFPELNVRTYVRSASGRPGVWFFSLDAARALAVRVARAGFHLAYMNASMRYRSEGGRIRYASRRTGPFNTHAFGETLSGAAEYRAEYGPAGEPFRPRPGRLESFFTDRYCLYSWSRAGRLFRGEIHHNPWALQPAEADIELNTMTAPLGINTSALGRPLLHYSKRMDVVAWWPRPDA